MDFRPLLDQHVQTGADVTIGTVAVGQDKVSRFGILQMEQNKRVSRFVEKPADPKVLAGLRIESAGTEPQFLASMGIYVFSCAALQRLLDCGHSDFGREIIPGAILSKGIFAYLFEGYWEDIGNVRSFFEANLELVSELPRFNMFDMTAPFFSHPLYLPGAKVNAATLDHTLLAAGSIIENAQIRESVVGLRSIVGGGSTLRRVVMLGADYYESEESIEQQEAQGIPRVGIGRNARIENAIIDRNARIGDDVVITGAPAATEVDHESYSVREGLVIVARNGVIPHGTII
jgi:glucose-1-phosphate adenylyltransferase